MADTLATWFLVFLTYSVIGWGIEVLNSIVVRKKFSNRGFLIGPICPIYGVGVVVMTLILNNHADNILEVFLVAVGASAVIEYFTSYVMEKLFRVRWWDYSEKPFNIRGRISLVNLFYFGICGTIVIYLFNPVLFHLIALLNPTFRLVLAIILFVAFLADIAVSLWLIIKCRVAVGTTNVDATDEITANIKATLMDKGKLNRRLAKAFPDMKAKKAKPRAPRKKKTTNTSAQKTAKSSSKTTGKTQKTLKAAPKTSKPTTKTS